MKNNIIEIVQTKIYSIRNTSVMLDRDIAELYGVETKHINQAVKNNPEKFPDDFCFELSAIEYRSKKLNNLSSNLKSKDLTSSWGGSRKPVKAFTEQGVYMLATILKSKTANNVTVAIMRAFVELRQFTLTHGEIIEKINQLEGKITDHDETLSEIIKALKQLLKHAENKETKKIGFIKN